jgi:2-polyprenyl-3-methyl-5-hydroxy-6-metoxy-1,4-benzoquinol methylase
MSKVVITLPAYHAEATLTRTVADIPAEVGDELILVDDASSDNTAQVARQLEDVSVYVHPHNRGYGGNQKTCYTKAIERGADVVVMLHPDYQYDPKAVPLLIAPIVGGYADMTFGSRFAGLGDPRGGGMPRYRFYGNRITTILENVMLGSRFSEMHSGLRAYSRDCLLSLPFLNYSDDFWFDSQMMADAVTTGLRVVEVPIPTRYTKESSSISVKRSLVYVDHTLRYVAKASARRGRRGKRSPTSFHGSRKPKELRSVGTEVDQRCVVCGRETMALIYPSNVTGDVTPEEFACTSDALAQHDDILQCRACGMVSSRPTLDPQAIVHTYSEMTDDDYLVERQGRRDLFGWVLDEMDGFLVPGRRLLEIGSNVGLFLQVASERGYDAKGVEPSRWAVDLGRTRFGVDLAQGTVDDLSEPASSADAVVMLDVLEHLVDPVSDLSKLRGMLKPTGLLALSTINLAGLHGRLRDGRWPWFIRPHLHYFTPETLDATLHTAGFRLVHWSSVPRSFHLSYVARRAGRSERGAVTAAARLVARAGDPVVPLGWLGDVVLALARPGRRSPPA